MGTENAAGTGHSSESLQLAAQLLGGSWVRLDNGLAGHRAESFAAASID